MLISSEISDHTAQSYQEFTKSVEKFQNELVILFQKNIKLDVSEWNNKIDH